MKKFLTRTARSGGIAALIAAAALVFALAACPNPTDGGGATQHTITFNSQGGNEVGSITRNEGTGVDEPVPPTKAGFAFLGWYSSAAASGTKYEWPYTLNADVTMYAHWVSDEDNQKVGDFKENGTVKEALEQDAAEIGLDAAPEDLAGIEKKVDAALAEYAKLPEGAKEALAGEKAKLDAVKEKIGNVNTAHDFQDTYGEALEKAPDDLKTLEDVTTLLSDLNKALDEIKALPGPVQELLADEIARLESLKEKAEEIADANASSEDKAAAEGFREAHKAILGKTPEDIALGDEEAVDAAILAYSGLGQVVKALLLEEYGKLTDLKEKIETLKPFTITFNSQDGSPVDPVTEPRGTKVPEPTAPAKAGHTFQGWYDAASGGTKYEWPHTLNASVTMYAQWQAEGTPPVTQYTITFNSQEGSDVSPVTAAAGTKVPEPTAPAKGGHTFQGWYSAASGGTKYAWPHTLNSSVTMYAQWQAEGTPPVTQYTITFNTQDGSAVSPVTAAAGTKVPEPAVPTKGGQTFQGWYNAASGGTKYAWPHTLNANVTMYAQWQAEGTPPAEQYTITFNSQGGSAVNPVTAAAGTKVPEPAVPAKEGQTFQGWYSAASGGTKYAWPHTLNSSVTMYAQWQAETPPPPIQYTITFNSQGGSDVQAVTEPAGTQVPEPATPTRAGHTFQGWYGAASGGTKYTWPHTLNAGATMYAQWQAITYTVKYNANGGTGTMTPSTHTYGVAKNLTGNGFTKSGYGFGGWTAAADGSGASYAGGASVSNLSSTNGAEVNLYARWWSGASINITVWVIEDGNILASGNDAAISKAGGEGKETSLTAQVDDAYAIVRWELNGIPVPGNTACTIRAADYPNGTYTLGVQVTKNGIPYSTDIRVVIED
jgi:uncharacterized repeat protein (TIGR02543 family)